jgi:hypothetical protein
VKQSPSRVFSRADAVRPNDSERSGLFFFYSVNEYGTHFPPTRKQRKNKVDHAKDTVENSARVEATMALVAEYHWV